MKRWKWGIIIFLFVLLTGLVCFLFGTREVPLLVNGKTVAVIREPFWSSWNGRPVDVYAGKDKIFSLWEDFFDGPIFIYPFADGKRFLCDYDYDTSMLDFVVDFNTPVTNGSVSLKWPADDYVRGVLFWGATNVTFNTKGVVRLPTYEEIREVSDHLTGTTPRPVKPACLAWADFGSTEFLLLDLATNRQNVWPTK